MKVILLTDVKKVGHKYDVKDVAPGYASNFLFPQRLAEPATPSKIKNIEILQKRALEERKIQEELLAKNLDVLRSVSIVMKGKANERGHLFQGIHTEDIVRALSEQVRVEIRPEMIVLPHPIKSLGDFEISVGMGNARGKFKLSVEGE